MGNLIKLFFSGIVKCVGKFNRVLEYRVEFEYSSLALSSSTRVSYRVRANIRVSRGVVRVLESYTMPHQSLNSTIPEYRVEFE